MALTDDRGLYTTYLKTWGKVKSGANIAADFAGADWQEAAAMTLAVYDAQVEGTLRARTRFLQALQDLLQIDVGARRRIAAGTRGPTVETMTVPTRKSRLFARRGIDRDDFIDKLAQRWIVERAMVTMYGVASARLRVNRLLGSLLPDFERFAAQEQLHADMLAQLLGELGHGDVHGEHATPAVNLAASAMAAILESVRAPGATARSILEALLMAERIDVAGWELLIELAKEAELDDDYLRSFRAAGREEREHEYVVRTHLLRLERDVLLHQPLPEMLPHRLITCSG